MSFLRLRIRYAGAGLVLGLLAVGPALPEPAMDPTLAKGGSGSRDHRGTDPTLIAVKQAANLGASFEGASDRYRDDSKEDPDETEIVGFDNGMGPLDVAGGAAGRRDYQIDGPEQETYAATTGPVAPTPVQNDIDQALQAISSSPNTASTAAVISVACPASNERDKEARFSQDCNVLVDGALAPDPTSNDQARTALGAVTAEQATVSLASSRGSLTSQLQNLSARLGALRGGATGVSVRGLTISASGADGFGGARAGNKSATGGAAGADGGLFAGGQDRLGVFVNGTISSGDKDATINEDGFDFDGWGITAGVDYRFRTDLVAGLAIGYNKNDTDIDNDGGSLDTDGYSISLYGTYFHRESLYVDGVLTYGSNDYDQKRNIRYRIGDEAVNQTAAADYDGDQWSGAVGVGYDIPRGPWTLGPVARLQYVSADLDGYSERMSDPSGAGGGWPTRVDGTDQESFTSTIGGNLSRAIGTKWGVALPQMHLSWVHEFIDDAVEVDGSFIQDPTQGVFSIRSDKPDSDYFNARLGVSVQLARGNSGFLYYNKVFGYRDLDVDTLGVGVRLEF